MKSPPINIYQKQLTSWLAEQAFLRKFKRYWGTTTVNGVEVLKFKAGVHPRLSSRTRQLLKMLQILDQVTSEKYKGIKSAWLYLNPDKTEDIPVTVQTIRENVDTYVTKLITEASEYTTIAPREYLHTFSIKVVANRGRAPTVTPTSVENYLQTHRIEFSSAFAFVQFLLTPVSFTSNSSGRIEESKYSFITGEIDTTYKPATVCTYQFSAKDFNASAIAIKLKEFLDLKITGRRSKHKVSKHDLNILNIQRSTSSITPANRTSNAVWYVDTPPAASVVPPFADPSSEATAASPVYLRTSFLEDRTYSLDTRIETVTKAIDFDYKKKKASALSKLAVFVVVIGAAVLAVPSGGMSMAALATITVTVSVAITVTALLMYSWGDFGGANFARSANTAIAPYVQIAQFVLLIKTGVDLTKVATEAGKQGATEVGKEVAVDAGKQMVVETTTVAVSEQVAVEATVETATVATGQATESAADRILNHLLSKVDTKFVLKTLSYTVDLWSRNKLQEAKRENEKREEEIAEFEEGSKQNDLAQQFMDMYTKPLRMDWSIYAERYDRPYEPTNPKFHIGNIQATTVTAFNRIS